jgi:hypothetical protein
MRFDANWLAAGGVGVLYVPALPRRPCPCLQGRQLGSRNPRFFLPLYLFRLFGL